MENVVWRFMEPIIREHLIQKYVPEEPIEPLVYKITAFYWLFQELIGNWKAGRRLTLDQKAQLIELLVWNLSQIKPEPEDDIDEQVAQLVLACKEFQLKVA